MEGLQASHTCYSNAHTQTWSTILMCVGCKEPGFLKWLLIVFVFYTEVKETVFYFSKKTRIQTLSVPEAWGLAQGILLWLFSSPYEFSQPVAAELRAQILPFWGRTTLPWIKATRKTQSFVRLIMTFSRTTNEFIFCL